MITDAREPEDDLPHWPPYMLAILAFLAAMGLSAIVVIPYVLLRVWEPGVPLDELLGRMAATNQLTADILLLSTGVTGFVLTMFAVLPSARARGDIGRWSMMRRRLRLLPTNFMDCFAATVGVLGLGLMLDVVVQGSGLREEGSLAAIRSALGTLSPSSLVVAAVVIGVLPGLGEELFFRGYMMRRIERTEGVRTALIASSIVFGLFHADIVHTPTAAMVGFYLGVMVLWTGSLWTGVVAHTINNVTAVLTVGAEQRDELMWLWVLVGLNATVCGLWYAWRRHGRVARKAYW